FIKKNNKRIRVLTLKDEEVEKEMKIRSELDNETSLESLGFSSKRLRFLASKEHSVSHHNSKRMYKCFMK
ncbi:hypothetical protein PIB30_103551, partial [Stylosanthes scabra]|nr:hypothetical protein [Stylosanthes scabra]